MGSLSDLLGGSREDMPEVPDDASSLDRDPAPEADALPDDPAPSRRASGKSRRAARVKAAAKASGSERQQVRDALTMLYTLPVWTLQLRDPHCGGALMEQRDETIKALVPIVCRNPAMLAFFVSANAPWMDYLALLTALKPVATTVWAHHVSHTVGDAAGPDGGGPVDLSRYTA